MHDCNIIDSSILVERTRQGQFVGRTGSRGAVPEKPVTGDPWLRWLGKVFKVARPSQHPGTGGTNVGNAKSGVSGTDERGQVIHRRLPAGAMGIRVRPGH